MLEWLDVMFYFLMSSLLLQFGAEFVMGLRLLRPAYETVRMDEARLKLDLEYITQARDLPEGESLRTVLARLDAGAQTPNLHDRLVHYLTKRSYTKALIWLDNPDSPHHP